MRLVVAAAIVAILPVGAAAQQNLRAACRVGTLCPGVEPGSGQLMQCLRENRSRLSVACRLAIADRVLNRQGGGGGGRGDRDGGGFDGDRDGPGPEGRGQGFGRGGRDAGPDQGPDGSGSRGGYREGDGSDGPDRPQGGYRDRPAGGSDRGGPYDGGPDQDGPGPR